MQHLLLNDNSTEILKSIERRIDSFDFNIPNLTFMIRLFLNVSREDITDISWHSDTPIKYDINDTPSKQKCMTYLF